MSRARQVERWKVANLGDGKVEHWIELPGGVEVAVVRPHDQTGDVGDWLMRAAVLWRLKHVGQSGPEKGGGA